MALPKRQMRDFTELNMIYKAHRTNVWWTMKVFWLHWYILSSCFCTQPLKLWNCLTAIYYLILYFPFLYFWLALTGQVQDLCFSTIWLITKMEWFTVNKEVSKPYDYRYDCGQWTTLCDVIAILTVYPKKYAHGLCFVVVIHWLIFPYPSGLLHWHCGNLTIAPVPAKQPWWIWINTSCECIMKDCITTTKQSTTKPCAYFLGYTVFVNAKPVASCLKKRVCCEWPRLFGAK